MTRKAVAVLVATIPLLGLTGTGPAQAKDQTPCSFTFEADAAPGLSTSPSSGTYDSGGETGTIDCRGKVNGKTVTGPGTYGTRGRYGTDGPDTCTSGGEAEGIGFITVPTESGSEHLEVPYTATYGAGQNGVFAVTFKSEQFSGTAEVRPKRGDCFSSPMTRFTAEGRGTLTS